MKKMSFFLTTEQFVDRTKDVTRRVVKDPKSKMGWGTTGLSPGTRFMAIRKQPYRMKLGETIEPLGECVCVNNESEKLSDIIRRPKRGERTEVAREGFPNLSEIEFVNMFRKEFSTNLVRIEPWTMVNRIEFRRIT